MILVGAAKADEVRLSMPYDMIKIRNCFDSDVDVGSTVDEIGSEILK